MKELVDLSMGREYWNIAMDVKSAVNVSINVYSTAAAWIYNVLSLKAKSKSDVTNTHLRSRLILIIAPKKLNPGEPSE
jgi:hypothetical protein